MPRGEKLFDNENQLQKQQSEKKEGLLSVIRHLGHQVRLSASFSVNVTS